MAVSALHVRHQGPVLAAIGATAVSALKQRIGGVAKAAPATPTPELTATIPARDPALVADYLRAVGGDPRAWRGQLPPHFFPQWGFPLLARTLDGVPYPLMRVLNGGCRIDIAAPLPADEPLQLRACLESIDDNGSRAVLTQRLITGTASVPECITSRLYAIVPLKRSKGPKKQRPQVPLCARAVADFRFGPRAGLDFALLTGDFNPVHWIRPYAKASGFRSTILHGFATLAHAYEAYVANVLSGGHDRITSIDVKFTRPLVLPKQVRLFVEGGALAVGDAPGGPAYMTGAVTLED